MKIKFAKPARPKTGTLVVLASEGAGLASFGSSLDAESGGTISRAMKAAGFDGKRDKLLDILAPSGLEIDRVIVAGIGKPQDLSRWSSSCSEVPLPERCNRAKPKRQRSLLNWRRARNCRWPKRRPP